MPRPSPTPRRTFIQRIAASSAALVVGGWSAAAAHPAPERVDGPLSDDWLDRITGKHRQVFDCVSPNDGFGAAFGLNLLDSYKAAHDLGDRDVTAVVSYRHAAMPLMLDDAVWAKYHVGEQLGVKDPATSAIATRNIFRDRIMARPGLTYERAIAERGLIMTACNMALTALSGMLAPKAGVSAEQAKQEWTAGLLPGVVLVPSGVYAVNRAQEKGCTYCFGG